MFATVSLSTNWSKNIGSAILVTIMFALSVLLKFSLKMPQIKVHNLNLNLKNQSVMLRWNS